MSPPTSLLPGEEIWRSKVRTRLVREKCKQKKTDGTGEKVLHKGLIVKAKKRYFNRKKNIRLNENITEFVDKYSKRTIPERENEFLPEVLIPCYNHGHYLQDAIASVTAGTPVTVINDASTDNTAEVIDKLKKVHAFKVINNEINLTQTGSLNKAIAESANNLFIILNADDCLFKYSVTTLIKLFKEYSSVRMAGGGLVPYSIADIPILNRQIKEFNNLFQDTLPYTPLAKILGPGDARHYKDLNDINISMTGCAFLKSAWQAVDGFWDFKQRVCSFDDRDFQMRVNALFDVAVIIEPLSFYRAYSSQQRGGFIDWGW